MRYLGTYKVLMEKALPVRWSYKILARVFEIAWYILCIVEGREGRKEGGQRSEKGLEQRKNFWC